MAELIPQRSLSRSYNTSVLPQPQNSVTTDKALAQQNQIDINNVISMDSQERMDKVRLISTGSTSPFLGSYNKETPKPRKYIQEFMCSSTSSDSDDEEESSADSYQILIDSNVKKDERVSGFSSGSQLSPQYVSYAIQTENENKELKEIGGSPLSKRLLDMLASGSDSDSNSNINPTNVRYSDSTLTINKAKQKQKHLNNNNLSRPIVSSLPNYGKNRMYEENDLLYANNMGEDISCSMSEDPNHPITLSITHDT
eukprot:UN06912